jgi:hypothetical protein
VNRLHKVLEDAGVKLAVVASDVLGVSGRAMLEALLKGTTDPELLAERAGVNVHSFSPCDRVMPLPKPPSEDGCRRRPPQSSPPIGTPRRRTRTEAPSRASPFAIGDTQRTAFNEAGIRERVSGLPPPPPSLRRFSLQVFPPVRTATRKVFSFRDATVCGSGHATCSRDRRGRCVLQSNGGVV